MMSDSASVTVGHLPARVGACEMCSTPQEQLRTSVRVQNLRGGAVELIACDRCAAAMRRLLAIAGSSGPSGPVEIRAETVPAHDISRPAPVEGRSQDVINQPVLVHQFSDPFIAATGQPFTVAAHGQERSDGTWIGWLEFVGPDGTIKRTNRETTQSTSEHLTYWATGLQSSFFDGAFNRAT